MREIIGSDELKAARLRLCDLSGAEFRSVDFRDVVISDAWLMNADFSGDIAGLRINGVEVEPLVEAELDRLHPERTSLRPTDVDGLRRAFDVVDTIWTPTIDRARELPEPLLHQRVNGEFSFVETLRHLIFATDAWLLRFVMHEPDPMHPWGMGPDLDPTSPTDDGPSLDAVLDVRRERSGRVRSHVDRLSDDDLDEVRGPPDDDGHPQGERRILDCFRVVLREEWWHHRYAVRDLEILTA